FERLKAWNPWLFFSDDFRAYNHVIPEGLLMQGKRYTIAIERANSNLRHYFARFSRRCKSFSRALDMVEITVGLFATLNNKSLKN
ncbi:MAG: IS1 family transposase, partial [Vampirovibrionales bacterium]|nr:IS1 family transposase [Vampirovibrionales bacterium]MEB3246165.1 IS1 family transposase [Vampirovibrionales bacterium]